MTADDHDPARPGLADQRAALAAYSAILLGATPAQVHDAAQAAACPACAASAAASLGVTIAQELAGAGFVNGPLRPQLLAMLKATLADLDASAN